MRQHLREGRLEQRSAEERREEAREINRGRQLLVMICEQKRGEERRGEERRWGPREDKEEGGWEII